MPSSLALFFTLATGLVGSVVRAQTYTATYTPEDTPYQSEQGQYGTNQCGTGSSQDSLCQNAYINGIDDFCLWAPPYSNGQNATIGETERIEVAWCMKSGYGTRLIPDGTIIGAHFVQTPDYVQISGNGIFSNMGIPNGDAGGELDPHGADGNGNPIGGLVFGNSFGVMQQYHEWTSFMSITEFCFRACKPAPNAPVLCNHIYDVMGCQWNMPGDYSNGIFDSCLGDSAQPMGIYTDNGTTSTFHQGDAVTPSAHPVPSTSSCVDTSTIADDLAIATSASSSSMALMSGMVSMTVVTSGSSLITYMTTETPMSTATKAISGTGAAAAATATTSNAAHNGTPPSVAGAPWNLFMAAFGVVLGTLMAL